MDFGSVIGVNETQFILSLNATQFEYIFDYFRQISNASNENNSTITAAVITGAIALIVTLINLYFNKVLETKRLESTERNNQQQAYSQLVGSKFLILHILESYHLSILASEDLYIRSIASAIAQLDFKYIRSLPLDEQNKEFTKIFNKIRGKTSEAKAFEEQSQRYQDLEINLGECCERLWKTIGFIQTVFPKDDEIERQIQKIIDSQKKLESSRDDIFAAYRPLRKSLPNEACNVSDNNARDIFVKRIIEDLEKTTPGKKGELMVSIVRFKMAIEDLSNNIKPKIKQK